MNGARKQAWNGIATQALARPAAGDEAARACNPKGCNARCQAQGGFVGRCNDRACLCLF